MMKIYFIILFLILITAGCLQEEPSDQVTADQIVTDQTIPYTPVAGSRGVDLTLINVGTNPNDHTGDPLRTAFIKTNLAITQINTNTADILLKANIASPTFTGTVTLPTSYIIGTTVITSTGAQLNYLNSVTSDVQTQINAKASLASPTFTGLVKLNTDTLATQAYARSQGGTGGSMTYPGAGIALSSGSSWGTSITDNSTNWNTAYSDRMKWDGGATGLTAATGRTSLGATTVGSAFFTLTNPSLITFPRINADNTITARPAADFKTDLSLNNVTNESKSTMFASPTFTGTVTVPTPFTLGTVSVTSTGTQINYLSGTTGTTGTGKLVFDTSPSFTTGITTPAITLGATALTVTGPELNYVHNVTSAIQTQLDARGRVYSDTIKLLAGQVRVKATTLTTEPYSVQIFSSGGRDITHAVSDSVALNGGVIKLYVYSVDALTGCKLKILY